jgi:hypothetical protein
MQLVPPAVEFAPEELRSKNVSSGRTATDMLHCVRTLALDTVPSLYLYELFVLKHDCIGEVSKFIYNLFVTSKKRFGHLFSQHITVNFDS